MVLRLKEVSEPGASWWKDLIKEEGLVRFPKYSATLDSTDTSGRLFHS